MKAFFKKKKKKVPVRKESCKGNLVRVVENRINYFKKIRGIMPKSQTRNFVFFFSF